MYVLCCRIVCISYTMSVTYVVLIESVNVIYRLEYNDCRFSDACE